MGPGLEKAEGVKVKLAEMTRGELLGEPKRETPDLRERVRGEGEEEEGV